MNGGNQPSGANGNYKDNNKDNHDEANNGDFHDFGEHDGDDPEHPFMDDDALNLVSSLTNLIIFWWKIYETLIHPFEFMQNDGQAAEFHNYDGFGNDESHCQESLEDLCRSHLVTILV